MESQDAAADRVARQAEPKPGGRGGVRAAAGLEERGGAGAKQQQAERAGGAGGDEQPEREVGGGGAGAPGHVAA